MTEEEKKIHVDNILKSVDLFDDLAELPVETLDFRPSPDRWTIREHLIHCLDVDIANFNRYRAGMIEPGIEIAGMDDRWTERLAYSTLDITDALQTIKLIRKMAHSHMSTIINDDWTAYSILYKKYGVLNFEVFIPVFHKHPTAHREMIDRLLDEWRA